MIEFISAVDAEQVTVQSPPVDDTDVVRLADAGDETKDGLVTPPVHDAMATFAWGHVDAATTEPLKAHYDSSNRTLTSDFNTRLLEIDGAAVPEGARILVWRQEDPRDNGIYVMKSVGAVDEQWVMERAADADVDVDFLLGKRVVVKDGDRYGTVVFEYTVSQTAIGTTNIVFRRQVLAEEDRVTSVQFELVGDDVWTEHNVNHNLGTMSIVPEIYDLDTGATVDAELQRIDANNLLVVVEDPIAAGRRLAVIVTRQYAGNDAFETYDVMCQESGAHYVLSGLPIGVTDRFGVRFYAPNNYTAGGQFSILQKVCLTQVDNGMDVAALAAPLNRAAGQELRWSDDNFVGGAEVTAVVDLLAGRIYRPDEAGVIPPLLTSPMLTEVFYVSGYSTWNSDTMSYDDNPNLTYGDGSPIIQDANMVPGSFENPFLHWEDMIQYFRDNDFELQTPRINWIFDQDYSGESFLVAPVPRMERFYDGNAWHGLVRKPAITDVLFGKDVEIFCHTQMPTAAGNPELEGNLDAGFIDFSYQPPEGTFSMNLNVTLRGGYMRITPHEDGLGTSGNGLGASILVLSGTLHLANFGGTSGAYIAAQGGNLIIDGLGEYDNGWNSAGYMRVVLGGDANASLSGALDNTDGSMSLSVQLENDATADVNMHLTMPSRFMKTNYSGQDFRVIAGANSRLNLTLTGTIDDTLMPLDDDGRGGQRVLVGVEGNAQVRCDVTGLVFGDMAQFPADSNAVTEGPESPSGGDYGTGVCLYEKTLKTSRVAFTPTESSLTRSNPGKVIGGRVIPQLSFDGEVY